MNYKDGKTLKKYYCVNCKKEIYYRSKRCRNCNLKHRKGKSHPNWKGGKPKCIDCGKQLKDYKSKRCIKCANKGNLHPLWRGGRRKNNEYIMLYSPNHPFKDNNNYVLEHRLVMEKIIGRYLKPEEIVHHINGIKNDNRPNNLMLFPTYSAHRKFIHYGKKNFICKFCGRNQKTN